MVTHWFVKLKPQDCICQLLFLEPEVTIFKQLVSEEDVTGCCSELSIHSTVCGLREEDRITAWKQRGGNTCWEDSS